MTVASVLARPDFECHPIDASEIGDVEGPIPLFERVTNQPSFRRVLIVVILLVLWEAYSRWLGNPIMLPTLTDTIGQFGTDLRNGVLIERAYASLRVLAIGYGIGLGLAVTVAGLAITSRMGFDALWTLSAMLSPLPSVALLPLALLWFGLGTNSIVFVVTLSVLWPVALNMLTGFRAVPATLRMSGENYGLTGWRMVIHLLVPAAFPSLLAGLKIGWAFAWRTLVAAKLVFGSSSRSGGLGWYIFEARSQLETATVFAGLLAIILIGLFVEAVVFRLIEEATVEKWGMQRI